MPLTRVTLKKFTAFSQLDDVPLSPGVNVFIGKNGTGKTHLLKVLYSACKVTEGKIELPEKLVRVFVPSGGRLGRLVHRQVGVTWAEAEVRADGRSLRLEFTTRATDAPVVKQRGWMSETIIASYIPAKEFLSHAVGFRSLYERREVAFEEVYDDLLAQAYLPPLRDPDPLRDRVLEILRKAIEGKVVTKGEEFFLRNRQGNLEFSLLAEGMRKLGLLWVLVENGTLLEGTVLFWDEPEANLNPSLIGVLVGVLLELQRAGVQVFLATHDYVVLKEIDLQRKPEDKVNFVSFYRDEESGEVKWAAARDHLSLHPNAITQTFADLYDRDVRRALDEGPSS